MTRIRVNMITIIAVVTAMLSVPTLSMAEISFQSTTSSVISNDIFGNLPTPVNDLINNFKGISDSLNGQFGKYFGSAPVQGVVNTGINQVNQMNPVEWGQSILKNSFLSGIYSIVVKILDIVGNLLISVLGIIIDLIKQGLSMIH